MALMTTALKDLTLKAARHWVVNLILRIGAYKNGRYENIWLNTLGLMSNVEVFAMQEGQTGEYDSLHISIRYSNR